MASVADAEIIGLGNSLAEMVPAISQALEQGEAHERALREAANKQRTENHKMRRALSVIDPEYAPQTQTAKSKGSNNGSTPPRRVGDGGVSTGFGVSSHVVQRYVDEILRLTAKQKFVTQPEVYRNIGSEQGKASATFRFLRQIGFLRKAGKVSGSSAEKWAVLDRNAFSAWLTEVEEVVHG